MGDAGWAALRLTNAERDSLRALASAVTSDPYREFSSFRAAAREGWLCLLSRTRVAVGEFAGGVSARPELYIENLPCPADLPPTPVHAGEHRPTCDTLGEYVMTVFSCGLGCPISYLDQRDGRIFHDVYPTYENAGAVSSHSSRVGLGFHTEMFFHPAPPDYVMLHCLRSDPRQMAGTWVAAAADIELSLCPRDRMTLRQPRFALDLAHLHGRYRHRGNPIQETDPRPVIPVLADQRSTGFRFEPALMTPLDAQAEHSMCLAEQAAERCAARGKLREGGLLLIDNRRAAHARTAFPARFDGADRWLRRMMLARSASPASDVVRYRHNLELIDPWRATGAVLQEVSYPLRSGR
ncbi:TauD/TfdA family dioxygenase [Nocardia nova]|nr:TauD/TfdA family dioxygenase [Nocardia nova]